MWYGMLFNLFYSVCPCLSFILSVLVTNKRTYNNTNIERKNTERERQKNI